MIAIDLANAGFLICVAVAGLLLLAGALLDDDAGRLLDNLHLRAGVNEVPIVVYVLAFICGFGIGGLIGTAGMNAETLPAIGVGVAGGLLGIVLAWANSDARKSFKASAKPRTDLGELVGRRARASVPLSRTALGTVSMNYRGAEREFAATAGSDIPAGSVVVVNDVDEATSTLEVTLASHRID